MFILYESSRTSVRSSSLIIVSAIFVRTEPRVFRQGIDMSVESRDGCYDGGTYWRSLKGYAVPPPGPTQSPQDGCFLLHYGLRRLLELFVPRCSVILFRSSLVFALQCSVHNTSGHEVKMPVIRIKLHIQRLFCCKIANEVSRSDPQEPWQQVKTFVHSFGDFGSSGMSLIASFSQMRAWGISLGLPFSARNRAPEECKAATASSGGLQL